MASGEAVQPGQGNSGPPPGAPEPDGGSSELHRVPQEIRDVSFPVSVRGYERRAVDAYVSRVTGVIEELEATRSPEAAVREALEQVGAQTKGVLQQAGETAEEIIVSARREAEESTARARTEAEDVVAQATTEADETLARSKAEAEKTAEQSRKEAAERLRRSREEVAALRQEAETHLRALHADTEAVREERRQLLDDIRGLSARVEELASAADARFPPRVPAAEAEEGEPAPQPEAESEPSEVANPSDAGVTPASRRRARRT